MVLPFAASLKRCLGAPREAREAAIKMAAEECLYSPVTHQNRGFLRCRRLAFMKSPRIYLQRVALRHGAHHVRLVLLLLVGISSTLLAAGVDKCEAVLSEARTRISHDTGGFGGSYLVWIGSALVLCFLSAACVQFLGPSAAGSGIPQMKCVLAGVQIHDYLSLRTLAAKALSLVLALAGGLSIGKEGPYVHMASCVAHQLSLLRPFRRIANNEELRHECSPPHALPAFLPPLERLLVGCSSQ